MAGQVETHDFSREHEERAPASAAVASREFTAEARQLLQLVIHSIYSNKDIFLRELISNASDALDKLKMATYRGRLPADHQAQDDKELDADISDLHIEISVDRDARTLTVRDNGIGMTHDEVVDLIGTIARSGTAELLRRLREASEPAGSGGRGSEPAGSGGRGSEPAGSGGRGSAAAPKDLIGQFGVGFYSSFMVADSVTLVTRRAGHEQAVRWSSDGQGTYTIEPVDDAPYGTSVTLHLKPADDEDHLYDYTAEWKIREIVKRYSDFIPWPIRMAVQRSDAEGNPSTEIDTLNSMKALWARPRDEVSDEEYHEFYKHLSHDWTDPLETIHMRGEGAVEYEALLFLPARAPFDLFHADAKRGIQLYVKRVFIMDDCEELIPPYLRFVKGVVDAHDLSLNVSREILQRDRQIQVIRKRLVRKVLGTIKEMMTQRPESYRTFWTQFGRALKEGLLSTETALSPEGGRADNRETILECCSFASTHDATAPVTLADYVSRMKEGQESIYVLTGESRGAIEASPHLEAFRANGYEVLLLTDPVDEVWVDLGLTFDGKPFQSVARGQIDLPGEAGSVDKQQHEDFAALLSWMTGQLDAAVKEVRLSTRLTTSPACIVVDAADMTPALQRMLRAMGQEVPTTKVILEVNPDHPLVQKLREAHAQRPDDEALAGAVELLYGTAVLAEGGDLPDPARFARLLADRLADTLR
jgi:molecular chaperone HtpG